MTEQADQDKSQPNELPAPGPAAITEPTRLRDRLWPWYVGIALVAVIMRAIAAIEVKASSPMYYLLQGDTRSYHDWGSRIAAGDWLGQTTFYQAPLYPYFVGLVYTLFGVDPLAVRKVQILLAAAACVMLAEAGRRWFGRSVGILAGFMLALYPPAVYFALINQKPGLALPLICLLVMLMAIADGKRRWTAYTAVGMTLGLLALNRENTLIWLPVVAAWSVLSPWPWQTNEGELESELRNEDQTRAEERPTAVAPMGLSSKWPWLGRAGQFVLVIVGLIAILLPVAMRNQAVGGEFHLTTSQFGTNFYIGNNPEATGLYRSLRWGRGDPKFERTDAIELAEQAEGRKLTPGEVSAYWTNRSLAYIREQPFDWAALMWRKTLLTFNHAEVADADDYYSYKDLSLALTLLHPVLNMGVLVPLAVLGAFGAWRSVRRWWPVALLFLSYAAGVIVFYIMARYRFPLVPLLMLPAAAGIVMGLPNLLIWRNRRIAVVLIAVIATAVFCNWPLLPLDRMRGTAQLNVAIQLLAVPDDMMLDDAADHIERARELNPESGMVSLVLAEVRSRQGRYDEAAAFIKEADERLPAQPAADARMADVLATMAFYAATDPDEENRPVEQAAAWGADAVKLSRAKNTDAFDAVAAAAAQLGEFEKALRYARVAAQTAEADGDKALAAAIRERVDLYESGKAYVRPAN